MWLSEKDRKRLNDVFARAHKKYFGWKVSVPGDTPMTSAEAHTAARESLEQQNALRRAEINARHDARVLAINTQANARGLITSTIVLQQLQQAQYNRDRALALFETVTEQRIRTTARQIMASELGRVRLQMQADRDGQNMVFERTRVGGIPQADLQRAVDEEVYAEYLRFLLALSPEVALAHVDHDPLFLFNLSTPYFNRLKAEMERRGWRT